MKFFLPIALLFPVVVFSQQEKSTNDGFVINGTITGLKDNSLVYLATSETDTIAKAAVKQNKFLLQGKLVTNEGAMLIMPSIDKRVFLFIGNERINIAASNTSLSDMVVSGSANQSAYEEFIYEIKPLNDFVNYYRSQVQSATSEPEKDSALIMLNTAYNIYQTSIDHFISRKKSSPVSALVLAFSYDMDPNKDVDLLEKRLNSLDEKALQNRYAENIKRVIAVAKVGAVGTKAMDFTQTDTAGKNVSLSQFHGKYVLVDFWASWCRPCRAENPNVVAAYNEYKDKNFTILSVSLDQEKESWLNAIRTDHLAWTHVSDLQFWGNAVAKMYNIESIPANFLIDPNGVIIAKNLRGEDLTDKLKEVLK